jgi:hypothetical protein
MCPNQNRSRTEDDQRRESSHAQSAEPHLSFPTMKHSERSIIEKLAFAHACTGEPLYAEALQEIEKRDQKIEQLQEDQLLVEEAIGRG